MPSRVDKRRIDHDDQILAVAADADVDDEDAQRDADLCRREADARRGVHRLDHVVDEALQVVVERRHVGRRLVQRPLAVAEDGTNHRERKRARTAAGRSRDRALEVGDRVAAEPLDERVGEHERDHRFADDRGGRDGTDVAALDRRRRFLHRGQVDRPQRLHERRDGLHPGGDAKVFAVGHAAFEPAGVVGRTGDAGVVSAGRGPERFRRGRAIPAARRLPARGRRRRP